VLHLYNEGVAIPEALSLDRLPQKLQDEYDESPTGPDDWDVTQYVMRGYDLWRGGSRYWGDANLEVIEPEMDFELPLGPYIVGGTFDGLVRHKETGKLYLLEYKTCKKGAVGQMIKGCEYDLQPRVYLWAARKIFDPSIDGVIYTFLAKEDITEVNLKKNGLPSKSVQTLKRTNLEIYTHWIEKQGGSLEDYRAELDFLANTVDSPLARHVAYFTHGEIEGAEQELLDEGKRIEATLQGGLAESTPHRSRYHCPYCPVREPCRMVENDPETALDLMDIMFTQRKEREH
jgi:hypothetical protein